MLCWFLMHTTVEHVHVNFQIAWRDILHLCDTRKATRGEWPRVYASGDQRQRLRASIHLRYVTQGSKELPSMFPIQVCSACEIQLTLSGN